MKLGVLVFWFSVIKNEATESCCEGAEIVFYIENREKHHQDQKPSTQLCFSVKCTHWKYKILNFP